VNDVLGNFDVDFEFVFGSELIKAGEVSVTDHLVLVVAKAEEDYTFSVLQAWINDLQLEEETCEFYWQCSSQNVESFRLRPRFAALDEPQTDFIRRLRYVHFQVPASPRRVKGLRYERQTLLVRVKPLGHFSLSQVNIDDLGRLRVRSSFAGAV